MNKYFYTREKIGLFILIFFHLFIIVGFLTVDNFNFSDYFRNIFFISVILSIAYIKIYFNVKTRKEKMIMIWKAKKDFEQENNNNIDK